MTCACSKGTESEYGFCLNLYFTDDDVACCSLIEQGSVKLKDVGIGNGCGLHNEFVYNYYHTRAKNVKYLIPKRVIRVA